MEITSQSTCSQAMQLLYCTFSQPQCLALYTKNPQRAHPVSQPHAPRAKQSRSLPLSTQVPGRDFHSRQIPGLGERRLLALLRFRGPPEPRHRAASPTPGPGARITRAATYIARDWGRAGRSLRWGSLQPVVGRAAPGALCTRGRKPGGLGQRKASLLPPPRGAQRAGTDVGRRSMLCSPRRSCRRARTGRLAKADGAFALEEPRSQRSQVSRRGVCSCRCLHWVLPLHAAGGLPGLPRYPSEACSAPHASRLYSRLCRLPSGPTQVGSSSRRFLALQLCVQRHCRILLGVVAAPCG